MNPRADAFVIYKEEQPFSTISKKPHSMTKSKTSRRNRINVWVAIGAIILIILLIIWLTFADLTGNTDVAAFLSPYIASHPSL